MIRATIWVVRVFNLLTKSPDHPSRLAGAEHLMAVCSGVVLVPRLSGTMLQQHEQE